MSANTFKPAYAYQRVSSEKQSKEGNGMSSQMQECQEYAKQNGYYIINHFQDNAISGGERVRGGMDALITACKKDKGCAVIFPSTSRLARDVVFLLSTVKTLLYDFGCDVKFFNLPGMDLKTPIGWFMLTTAGGTDELHKNVNTEQIIKRRLSRQQLGYYIDSPPVGYHKPTLSPDRVITIIEETRDIYQQVFRGYANGIFNGCSEIETFLGKHDIVVRDDQVKRMLANPLYAGYIHKPNLGINMLKAKHEALIDLATHYKIIERLTKTKPAPDYMTIYSSHFTFKGFARCACCDQKLTAGTIRKALKLTQSIQAIDYYWCKTRNCELKNKTISAIKLEDTLINYLASERLNESTVDFLREDIKVQRKALIDANSLAIDKLRTKIAKLDDERNKILDKIINIDNPEVVKSLEARLLVNQDELVSTQQSLAISESQTSTTSVDGLNPLLNISKTLDLIYINSTPTDRQDFLKLVFPSGFQVKKDNQELNVLNPQKSPLLRGYWIEIGLKIQDGGAFRTDFEPAIIYQDLLDFADQRRDLIKVFG
jgi:site-specific DNA recombinase